MVWRQITVGHTQNSAGGPGLLCDLSKITRPSDKYDNWFRYRYVWKAPTMSAPNHSDNFILMSISPRMKENVFKTIVFHL